MNSEDLQRFGPLVINHTSREVTLDGERVGLTAAEYAILTTLANEPRTAISSEALMRVLTGSDWVGGIHALHVTVSRLRAKLGESGEQPRRLITVHGFGYRFDPILEDSQVSRSRGLDSGQSAYFLAALDNTIIWASPNIEELLGWKASNIEGMSLTTLIHENDRQQVIAAREDLEAGFVAATMFRLQINSGDFIPVETFARPLIAPDGTTLSFLGEFHPLTGDVRQHNTALSPTYLKPPSPSELDLG